MMGGVPCIEAVTVWGPVGGGGGAQAEKTHTPKWCSWSSAGRRKGHGAQWLGVQIDLGSSPSSATY